MSPAAHPELLNIEAEYASNLKFLLGLQPIELNKRPSPAPVFAKPPPMKLPVLPSKPTPFGISNANEPPVPSFDTLPKEITPSPQKDNSLKPILEESYSSDITSENGENERPDDEPMKFTINVRETARFFHTNLFGDNKSDLTKPVEIDTSFSPERGLGRSKSFGRRTVSARIQSLAENFESADHSDIDSPSPCSDVSPRVNEKRPAKPISPESSAPGTKVNFIIHDSL